MVLYEPEKQKRDYDLEKVCSQLGILKGNYSGLKIYEFTSLSKCPVNPSLTLSHAEKASLKGSVFSFDVHIGSYMYPVEVVASAWSNVAPVIEVRAFNNGTFRMETPIEIHKCLAMLEEIHGKVRKLVWFLDHAKR